MLVRNGTIGGDLMQQQTFTDMEYARRKKKSRREKFLDTMDAILPWEEWDAAVLP